MEMKKRECCGVQHCPCYPNCDQMMSGDWEPKRTEGEQMEMLQTGKPDLGYLDKEPVVWKELLRQDEEDLARLKDLYPSRIRQILGEVERVCDSMEYEGSIMFDEMPEKQRIQELAEGIEGKMREKMEQWEEELAQQQEEDIYVMNHRMATPPSPCSQPTKYPCPRRNINWFGDLIQVLLQDEMYHRRCRCRNCRRW